MHRAAHHTAGIEQRKTRMGRGSCHPQGTAAPLQFPQWIKGPSAASSGVIPKGPELNSCCETPRQEPRASCPEQQTPDVIVRDVFHTRNPSPLHT